MFFHITPRETTVRNKEELLDQIKKCIPGDIILVKGTSYSLTISENIHEEYVTKHYKTNLDYLIAKIKRTAMKTWSY